MELQEFVQADSSTTFEPGVIKGVKVLGFTSRNKRSYAKDAVEKAAPLYEGCKVYTDHQTGPRKTEDSFGVLQGVTYNATDGLRGNLVFLESHQMAPKVVEALKRPELNNLFGLSHQVTAQTKQNGDIMEVSSIEKVLSCDLVTDPATCKNLLEQVETVKEEIPAPVIETITPKAPEANLNEEFIKLKDELSQLKEQLAKLDSLRWTVPIKLKDELSQLKEQLAKLNSLRWTAPKAVGITNITEERLKDKQKLAKWLQE